MNVKKEAQKFLVWKSYKNLQIMLGRYPSIVEITENINMNRTIVISCIKELNLKTSKFTSQRGFSEVLSVSSENIALDKLFDSY